MDNKNLSDIKVLIWDLDGTLYKNIPLFGQAIRRACLDILSAHKNIAMDEAISLLDQTIRIHKSNSRSLQFLGCGSRLELIYKIEDMVDKASFLKPDPKLQDLFQNLSGYRHFLLSDTTMITITKELEALGLSASIFDLVIGVDLLMTTKPDLSLFQEILNHTKLPARSHLSIGDRVEVDLVPAKQLGMKTCLAWVEDKDPRVDYTVASIYNIPDLFQNPAQ